MTAGGHVLAHGSRLKTALAALVLAATAALWMGGCTSDGADVVGSGLVDTELTEVLVNLLAQDVANYGPIQIEDPDLPLHRQQVLYLGSQGGVSSRMVMNYDFADIFSEDYPETLFTAEHIKSVKLSLTKLSHYGGMRRLIDVGGDTTYVDSGQPLDLYYTVQQLTAPFDSTAFVGYPNAAPPFGGPALNSDFLIPIQDNEPFLRMYEQDFIDWLGARQSMGLIISLGVNSDPGMIGFAARELVRYSELDDVTVGTVVAPNLVVEFEDGTITNFLLAPYSDTSTFETVPPAPDDPTGGFVVRTCLRSYPALDFDFSALPDNVLINRAVLRLTNDTDLAFGNSEAIVVAEFSEQKIIDAPLTMTPVELNVASYLITGQVSLDPTTVRHLAFDVTTLVQRIANNVYPDPRGLVLAAAEDAFTTYDLSLVDPDFYFTEFRFMGTTAADSLRPRLEITYSHYDERLGGGR
jgi:hypothetical protein